MAVQTHHPSLVINQPVYLDLIYVPAGEFIMGSDPTADRSVRPSECPQHTVIVSGFYLGKYLVTNAQYAAFIKATGHKAHQNWLPDRFPVGTDQHPAIYVSWFDAQAFCHWLSRETAVAFRLPTEAEWEKAARGTDGRLYPWGNEWDVARLNYGYVLRGVISLVWTAATGTTPVGQFSPAGDSPYGAADMSGNVWEWCADGCERTIYQGRAETVVTDPLGPETSKTNVVRGGSWYAGHSATRCANRSGVKPDSQWNDLGFRVVYSPN